MSPPGPDRRRRKLVALGAALLALAATGGAATLAAFTATTDNSGNSFSAATSFPSTLRFASGSYTGNGADNRAIADPGFQPDLLIVKADTNRVGVARTATMTGDATKPLDGATALATNRIQSLTGSGFTVGTDVAVNANGTAYKWMAFEAGAGALALGSYTGNGGASRPITGAGFSPEYVAVLGASAQVAVQRFTGMTTTFPFGSGTGNVNAVNSLDTNGFTVGNANQTNANGQTYHYIAFNEVAGAIKRATYTGNNATRSITGVGFQPAYAMVRASDTGTARSGRHRSAASTGTASQFFTGTANDTAGITALQTDGFQLGTNTNVNASSVSYHYIAFKNTFGG